MSRPPSTVLAGTTLIPIALLGYLGWSAWTASRIWVPLDTPISLAKGHIRTSEFEINVAGDYKIVLDPGKREDPGSCLTGAQCSAKFTIATSWSLSKEGRVVAHGNSDLRGPYYYQLGTFKAEKGHYSLDLDVSKYGSGFNAGLVSLLFIEENGSLHSDSDARLAHALFVALACVFLGLMLILNGLVEQRRERLIQWAKAFSFTRPGPQPPTVPTSTLLPVSPMVASASRLTPARWGAILVLAGILGYVSVHYWMTTRSFAPVDIPVSLKPGHLRTGPFLINLSETYAISLSPDQQYGPGYYDCEHEPPTSSSPYGGPRLRTRRILYRNGQVASEPENIYSRGYFFHFDAEPGIYDLDVEVLTDVSCLDSFHPRLKIETNRTEYDDRAFVLLWACTLCAGTGASLLVIAIIRRYPRSNILRTPFTKPDVQPVNLRWKVPPQRWQSYSAAAWFGLITVNVQVPLLFVMIVVLPVNRNSGLPVRIFRAEKASQPIPGLEPVLVQMRLRAGESRPELYINSVLVPWDNFEENLQKALKRCPPEWPVYLEGDPDLEWGAFVNVVDRIQELHVPVTVLSHRPPFERSK